MMNNRKEISKPTWMNLATIIGCLLCPGHSRINYDKWPLDMTVADVERAIFSAKADFSMESIERAAQALADRINAPVCIRVGRGEKTREGGVTFSPRSDSIWKTMESEVEFLMAYQRNVTICDDCNRPESFDPAWCYNQPTDRLCPNKPRFAKSGA